MIAPSLTLQEWLSLAGNAKLTNISQQVTTGKTQQIEIPPNNGLPYVIVLAIQFNAVISGQISYELACDASVFSGWAIQGAMIPIGMLGTSHVYLTVDNGQSQDCLVNITMASLSEDAYKKLRTAFGVGL